MSDDVVSAEEAQGMLDRDRIAREVYGMHGGYDGARLARTVIALHRELAVLRAQLAPLLAVHDALVAAAALPGAGASPDEMVAAVRAQGAEAMRAGIVAAERERCARGRAVRGEDPRGRCVMDADQRTRLRALCSVDADPVRVHRTDLADVLDALDAAERERDDARAEVETLRAEAALLREIAEGRTRPPTDAEIAAHAAQRRPGLWLTRDDGGNVFVECGRATVARLREEQRMAGDEGTRWIALDASGRPCAWPTVTP